MAAIVPADAVSRTEHVPLFGKVMDCPDVAIESHPKGDFRSGRHRLPEDNHSEGEGAPSSRVRGNPESYSERGVLGVL